MKPLAAVVAGLLFASSAAFAQGVGSSGEIRGTVTDPSGAVLPNTNVTVVNAQTAFQRGVTTDATGQFRVTGLSPALYDVTVTRPGFATELRKGLPISIGQIVLADFQLKILDRLEGSELLVQVLGADHDLLPLDRRRRLRKGRNDVSAAHLAQLAHKGVFERRL